MNELMPQIILENVARTYTMSGGEEVHALRGISFSVAAGEFLSIMGPSGSGKSTCMNMIGCLDRPTSGAIFIDGKNTAGLSDRDLSILRNRTVGFVFQQYHLLPSLSVLENVMLPLRYQNVSIAERRIRAADALVRVGLESRMNHKPSELSGGQKQRTAIARATVTKPLIILADEPTGALDSETGTMVMELFHDINTSGTTVIIVTHNPEIGNATPRCISIFDGKIKEDRHD